MSTLPDEPGSDRHAESLARFVEVEARRRFFDPNAEPDPVLVAAGWERRFITDAGRARELLDLYAELGYETRAEAVRPEELADDCRDCRLASLSFRSIYTRRRRPSNPEHSEKE